MLRALVIGAVCLMTTPAPGTAQEGAGARIYVLMDMARMMEILRSEGVSAGQDMASDYLPEEEHPGFARTVEEVFDTDQMNTAMAMTFDAEIAARTGAEERAVIENFFGQGPGQRIVSAEMSARQALLSQDVEDAARERLPEILASDPELSDLVGSFIAVNDLVDLNVAGALSASFAFYAGLAEAGAIDADEDRILQLTWQLAEPTRRDTTEWLAAYLFMVYEPLDRSDLQAYVDLSGQPAGQHLNAALFASFGTLYDDIYRRLGQSLGRRLASEEL